MRFINLVLSNSLFLKNNLDSLYIYVYYIISFFDKNFDKNDELLI